MNIEQLKSERLVAWCQDGKARVEDATAAKSFIERLGMVTHYAASSEIPNLFCAYMSNPSPKVDASWDSPSGHVYEWRWGLGRAEAAFYGAVVAKKPTWIAWDVLHLVLGFAMERRDPEKLYSDGLFSNDAIRIVRAFGGTSGVLSTKDLRIRAGFPTGKEQRAAYLRAVEELDSKLFLAKTFAAEGQGDDMSHALVRMKYAKQVAKGTEMTPNDALYEFLSRYLAESVYFDPRVLAKHLRLLPSAMNDAVTRLEADGLAARIESVVAWVR